jgi:23S rRNA (cytidine1920-2'-O)/16S rRNA (cytidine1409-2'-O)-methyltransferase
MADKEKLRADTYLVAHGYAHTRAEAQAAILAGGVFANDQKIAKPAQPIAEGSSIRYRRAHDYVSRGALKLAAALDHFSLSPEGRVCLDIGASTGGFTQMLLERGASRVYAIDVGHGQLHPRLKGDPRIVSREGVNARDLQATHVSGAPTAIVADVSFIGVKLVLAPALRLAAADAWAVVLVKPQFEVGRIAVGKGGIVRDAEAREVALADIVAWMESQSWPVLGKMESPVKGGDGNIEFLLAAKRG